MMFTNPYIEPEQNIKKDGYLSIDLTIPNLLKVSWTESYPNSKPSLAEAML